MSKLDEMKKFYEQAEKNYDFANHAQSDDVREQWQLAGDLACENGYRKYLEIKSEIAREKCNLVSKYDDMAYEAMLKGDCDAEKEYNEKINEISDEWGEEDRKLHAESFAAECSARRKKDCAEEICR